MASGHFSAAHLQELRQMNIYPQQTVAAVLAEHYQSLQGGGDMSLTRNFLSQAVRRGFIIEKDLPYHSELFSLHGFHFELKCVRREQEYVIYMTRLQPTDPVLCFQHCERQTFSMRPDRDVRYCITAQSIKDGVQLLKSTGIMMHRFGLGGRTARSESLKPGQMPLPLHITFSILFPQS